MVDDDVVLMTVTLELPFLLLFCFLSVSSSKSFRNVEKSQEVIEHHLKPMGCLISEPRFLSTQI